MFIWLERCHWPVYQLEFVEYDWTNKKSSMEACIQVWRWLFSWKEERDWKCWKYRRDEHRGKDTELTQSQIWSPTTKIKSKRARERERILFDLFCVSLRLFSIPINLWIDHRFRAYYSLIHRDDQSHHKQRIHIMCVFSCLLLLLFFLSFRVHIVWPEKSNNYGL